MVLIRKPDRACGSSSDLTLCTISALFLTTYTSFYLKVSRKKYKQWLMSVKIQANYQISAHTSLFSLVLPLHSLLQFTASFLCRDTSSPSLLCWTSVHSLLIAGWEEDPSICTSPLPSSVSCPTYSILYFRPSQLAHYFNFKSSLFMNHPSHQHLAASLCQFLPHFSFSSIVLSIRFTPVFHSVLL